MKDRVHVDRPQAWIRRLLWVALVVWPLQHWDAPACLAGGGPENVLVVVNSASWASMAIANQFLQLRQIPPYNVFYIFWEGSVDAIDAETFRQKILGPVLVNIERRGLGDQIDYVVYSSDLPREINLAADLRGTAKPPQLSPQASLTGATYLWQWVATRNPNAVGLGTNEYMRRASGRNPRLPTHGFRSWYGWGSGGELLEAGGTRYMLSTMLGVTSGKGNSVAETCAYLERSQGADGTRPDGTIYYMRNSDPRTVPRAGTFDEAAADLKALGVKAEVISGVVPDHKPDVQGAMIGTATFSWAATGSTIRPGAICENLTSFGAVLSEGEGLPQTPLTEMLRYGAAGSSGTVVEPYAFQDKFPVPAMHVHYARGCSLAESYYQSVFGPYQLLIVGDPLCRPWANIPAVHVANLKAGDVVKGTVELEPIAEFPEGIKSEADRFELFVDGRRIAAAATGDVLPLDTTILPDGYHELRIVAIEAGPIESQGRLLLPVRVDNHGRSMTFTASHEQTVRWDQRLKLMAAAPDMDGVVFFHNGRVIGRFAGASGEAEINSRLLGTGPVTLHAVGVSRREAVEQVVATPVELIVKASAPLAALPRAMGERLARGLLLRSAGGKATPIQETRDPNWLSAAGVKADDTFELDGYFNVQADGVYQFQVWPHGELALYVDQSKTYETKSGAGEHVYLPVHLAVGLHHVRVAGRAGVPVSLRITFGGPGTMSLDGVNFRHPD